MTKELDRLAFVDRMRRKRGAAEHAWESHLAFSSEIERVHHDGYTESMRRLFHSLSVHVRAPDEFKWFLGLHGLRLTWEVSEHSGATWRVRLEWSCSGAGGGPGSGTRVARIVRRFRAPDSGGNGDAETRGQWCHVATISRDVGGRTVLYDRSPQGRSVAIDPSSSGPGVFVSAAEHVWREQFVAHTPASITIIKLVDVIERTKRGALVFTEALPSGDTW